MIGDFASLLPAVCAGVSAALWVRSPAEQLTRGASRPGPADRVQDSNQRWARFRARPDAQPLRTRVVVASAAALGLAVAMQTLGGRAGLLALVLIPVLAVVGTVLLGRLQPARSQREQAQLVQDLPQALELLSACLAAGMPLRRATRSVAECFDGPVATGLDAVLVLVDLGVSDAEAWRTLRTHPQWGPAAIDLARSVESGTMMVEVLVHHARDARSRRRADLEVRAKAVGVRSVLPLMTCFLPAFMLVGVVPSVASAVLNAFS